MRKWIIPLLAAGVLAVAGAAHAQQGTLILDPVDPFHGDAVETRLEVHVRVLSSGATQDIVVLPDDILDGTDDRRKRISLPAGEEVLLYGRSFDDMEYRYSYLAGNLGPTFALEDGEEETALFRFAEPQWLPPRVALLPGDSVVAQVQWRVKQSDVFDVDDSVFKLMFTVPPEAGTLKKVGAAYVFTAGEEPGQHIITVEVSHNDKSLHPYDRPFAALVVTLQAGVLKQPGGMAVDAKGNLYISDREEGTVVMVPKGEQGFVLMRGLERPGDVELLPGRIVVQHEDGVDVLDFGLNGQLRDNEGNVIAGAAVVVEETDLPTPFGFGASFYCKTDEEGRFHVPGLVRGAASASGGQSGEGSPENAALDRINIPVNVTVEWGGEVYSFELPLSAEGQNYAEITLGEDGGGTWGYLTVEVVGEGEVTPGKGVHRYPVGTQVPLVAQAAEGWAFDHWEEAVAGAENPAGIVANGQQTVRAVFVEQK